MMEDEETGIATSFTGQFDRAYDFLKHVTTLSLISIGGIFGLLQNDRVTISESSVMLSIGMIGGAAFVALTMNANIVAEPLRAPRKRKLTAKQVYIGQYIAMALLLFGAGVFTGAFGFAL